VSIFDKFKPLRDKYEQLKAHGADPSQLKFDEIISPTEAVMDGQRMILLGTNNYLGMTFEESCVESAVDAIREMGTGTTGSRIANGSYDGHRALEREIAEFYGMRDAMVFSTGYLANLGAIATLAGDGDHLLIDADSHASIYDASRLSAAQVTRFRHNNPDDLAKRLKRLDGEPGDKVVVIESIYSMLGDTAPLKEFIDVKREYGATLIIDEAHSLGVMGKTGRGLCEREGLEDGIDFVVGTFSKSIGTIGGYCVSDIPGMDLMRVAARPYMFTASLPPSVIASARTAFSRLPGATGLRRKLWNNASHLYDGLKSAGFELGPQVSPIVAIRLPKPELAIALWNGLLEAGIYTNLALPPATPHGWSLLRSSISAAHTPAQIETAVEACTAIGRELGIISVGTVVPLSEVRPAAKDGAKRPALQEPDVAAATA